MSSRFYIHSLLGKELADLYLDFLFSVGELQYELATVGENGTLIFPQFKFS